MKLNIQLFASGSFYLNKGTGNANWKSLQGRIDWSSIPSDTEENSSIVTTKIYGRTWTGGTSGRKWKVKIKVGNNTEHYVDDMGSSWADKDIASIYVLFKTFTDVVKHNEDGTCKVVISGSIQGPNETSLEGVITSGSQEVTLDQLHKVPDNVTYTMLETNEKVINAGIDNNTFVKDLSIKSFNISGNTYDNATIKEYAIFNRLNAFSSQTLPVIVDLTQNELQTDITYVSKIPIKAQIIDSYDTAGYSETILYDYVSYNKINLIETSTTAKRNGQTSGKVKLNVKGNLFNGIVGNVDQSTYKPIIKYKFWQTGTKEPTTYDYKIPSDNITIENGIFNVSGYEIGTTDETKTNWFNPDNAYKVKIYVEDNFTSYESQEKSIAVGEATWTEYKDRVDFKSITTKKMAINGLYDETNDSPLQVYDDEGNLFGKSCITCNASSNITNTGTGGAYTTATIIPLAQTLNKGDLFTLENNRIYFNRDCVASVSGQIYLTANVTSGDLLRLYIMRNNTSDYVLHTLFRMQGTYETITTPTKAISFSKGDFIDLRFNNAGRTGTTCNASYTFISVVEI